MQDTLQAGGALRDRRDAGDLSDHGPATARGRLLARLIAYAVEARGPREAHGSMTNLGVAPTMPSSA